MSVIIQFNSPSYNSAPTNIPCLSKTGKQEMVPSVEHSDVPVMTDEKGEIIDSNKNAAYVTSLKDVKYQYFFGLPYQDHNYVQQRPPSPLKYSPCPSPAAVVAIVDEDSNHSNASTTTEEAPEESITRCICGFEHDDEYMICCDNCLVWQHVDCMGLDRSNIPETYLCEKCEPRKLDRHKAKLLQARKKVVLTKIPPVKQEPDANNLVFGKNYKKKTPLQSPEKWQQGQGVANASQSERNYGSSDTDDDSKTNERRPKTRSKRRKREDEKELSTRKSKLLSKHGKERMEIKRSRLRRRTKESTSTADEEAQDAWAFSMEWCEENFESAVTNQYTPEVQQLARMLKPQGFEKKFFEQLQSKQCHIIDDGKKKQLVSLYDIPRNQPLIEYKGKYLLASQFHDLHPLYNKRLYPYIMFYTVGNTEICVDSSMYGNHARFVRRSCKPNAEMRHMAYNGNLHLFLQSTKVIFSEDEITVPLNFNQCENIRDIVCACGTEDCFMKPRRRNGNVEDWKLDKKLEKNHEKKQIPLAVSPEKKQFPLVFSQEKRRRTRRSTISTEEDSSQPVVTASSPEKLKSSPVKNELPEPPVFHSEINEQVIEMKPPASDHENDEHSIENRKKMTREQRKIEAYMRAFNQMEKAQRRKQQALERQKQHNPKSEETPEKSTESVESIFPKEEDKPTIDLNVSIKEELTEEEVKVQPPPAPPKPKKGKRRRGSGTSSRRRTRTNSGGSDILPTLEEVKQIMNESLPEPSLPLPIPEPAAEPSVTAQPPVSPPPPSPPTEESPYALKTKKFLLHERFKEESERSLSRATASSPRSIHTERKWSTSDNSSTCYVFCTKSTSGSSLAPNLLRSNSSGHLRTVGSPASVGQSRAVGSQGSAKKRWLRQAMHDCPVEPLSMDTSSMENLDSACLSPICHGDFDSPGASTDDILTPLKKRRLMRESIESLSSPHSPFLDNGMDDTDATTSSLTNDTQIDQKIDTIDNQLISTTNDNSAQFSLEEEDNSSCKLDDKLPFELAEENNAKKETSDNETMLGAILFEVVHNKNDLDSDNYESCKIEKSPLQIDCHTNYQISSELVQTDSVVCPSFNGDSCVETNGNSLSPALSQNNVVESSCVKEISPVSETSVNSECYKSLNNAPIDVPASGLLQPVLVNDALEVTTVNDVLKALPVNDALKAVPVNNVLEPVSNSFEDVPVNNALEAIPVNDTLQTLAVSKDVPLSKARDAELVNTDLPLNKAQNFVPINLDTLLNKELKAVPVNSDVIVVQSNSANQSVKAIRVEITSNQITFAQKPTLDSSPAEVTQSPVNNLSSIDISCASPITHVLELTAEAKIETSEDKSIEHLPSTEACENLSSNIKSTLHDISNNEKYTSETDTVDANKAMQTIDNHTVSNRSPNLSVICEKTVCSSDSSSSNSVTNSITVDSCLMPIKHSSDNADEKIIKTNGIKDSLNQLKDETTSEKTCASATKKRKVSLSEYRMRMRENTNKSRSNSDSGKSSVDGILGTTKNLPAQVTLAPLPLFDLKESAKEQSIKKAVAKKKKEIALIEEDSNQDTTEHRENLNERLKREFGFDVSESSSSLIQAKSKCNNQTTSDPPPSISNLHVDPQSLPPPPPPPRAMSRPIRPPQTAMGKVPASIPSQYGFVHSSFSRPPYGMPQVPGAPYIPPQPPLLSGGIHPMPATTPPCNLRAPLLPSTHSFTPGAPLLRTPTRHDYTPINAQRFASMPPRPTHYAYQSGLYK